MPISRATIARLAPRALELYDSGLSLAEVGAELGVSRSTVHNVLVRTGYKARNGGTMNRVGDDELERIHALLCKGLTFEEAAKKSGRSVSVVRRAARRFEFKAKQSRSEAPGRRTVLFIGEGCNERPYRVWCAQCKTYTPVAEATRCSKAASGFASRCKACNRKWVAAYVARKKSSPPAE